MNDAEIELLLYRILSGKLIFFYLGDRYELLPASPEIKYEAQLLYDKIINQEKYNEWIREEDAVGFMINLGLWTRDTMKIIEDLEKKIENSKVDLYKSSIFPDKEKQARKKLNDYKSQLEKPLGQKVDFLSNTLEGYANSLKNEHIICNTLHKNNKLAFKNAAGSDENSYSYFNTIVTEINKHTISIETFKELARSQIWRSYWNCNPKSPFNCSIRDITDEQKTLISITKMYDSVYEHPDCPPDKVIEDDDMLDGWMILQRRKSEQNKKKQKLDEINPKLKNAQEVFIMSKGQESYEEIMSLNTDDARHRMQEKVNFINAHGNVKDSDLPDVQRQIRTQAAETFKNRK